MKKYSKIGSSNLRKTSANQNKTEKPAFLAHICRPARMEGKAHQTREKRK